MVKRRNEFQQREACVKAHGAGMLPHQVVTPSNRGQSVKKQSDLGDEQGLPCRAFYVNRDNSIYFYEM